MRLLAIFVVAFLPIAAAPTQASRMTPMPACVSTDRAISDLLTNNQPVEEFVHLRGIDVRTFMVAYNAIRPITNYVADEVFGFYRSKRPRILFLVFQSDCYVAGAVSTVSRMRELFPWIELPILGEPA